MIAWILKNKEWLFSGLGVAVCTTIIVLLRRLVGDTQLTIARPTNQSASLSQTPSLTQSPSIHIYNSSKAHDKNATNQKRGPALLAQQGARLFALPPLAEERPVEVVNGADDISGDRVGLCLARFKLAASDPIAHGRVLEASINYSGYVVISGRRREQQLLVVNRATWIGGSINVSVSQGEAVELILAVSESDCLFAIDGNPIAIESRRPMVEVTLFDVNSGSRWCTSYRLSLTPLSVEEIRPLYKVV